MSLYGGIDLHANNHVPERPMTMKIMLLLVLLTLPALTWAAPDEETLRLEIAALCQAMPYRCPKGAAQATQKDLTTREVLPEQWRAAPPPAVRPAPAPDLRPMPPLGTSDEEVLGAINHAIVRDEAMTRGCELQAYARYGPNASLRVVAAHIQTCREEIRQQRGY